MTDYAKISESIAKTIAKAATPLTEDQKIAMSGALAVYLERLSDAVVIYSGKAEPGMPECVREMLKHFEGVMHGFERRGVTFQDGVSGIPTIKAVRDYYGEKE